MSGPSNLGRAELVRLRGPDARGFAQSQFCNDVSALPAGDWQWSAWLDAKGRVRCFFALIDAEDDCLFAWLPLGDAALFAQELSRFLFRSKLAVDVLDGWGMQGTFDAAPESTRMRRNGETLQLRIEGAQPRLLTLEPTNAEVCDADALKRWRSCDAADGLPLVDRACAGEFVPQALELEQLAAISFRKGCYPGQEVAARLHFRGGNKRGLRRIRWDTNGIQPIAGASLSQLGSPVSIGTLLYAGADEQGAVGLAVLTTPEIAGNVIAEPSVFARVDPAG